MPSHAMQQIVKAIFYLKNIFPVPIRMAGKLENELLSGRRVVVCMESMRKALTGDISNAVTRHAEAPDECARSLSRHPANCTECAAPGQ
jgi:hypothetical protein